MRFMLIVKASKESEAGVMPPMDLVKAMGKFNEEMAQAGVLLMGEGLQASSEGAKVKFAASGNTSVVDGPFAETKEVIAGFWMIQVASKEEAIEWARRSPAPHGPNQEAEIEVRRVFEPSDFGPEVEEQEKALRGDSAKRSVKS